MLERGVKRHYCASPPPPHPTPSSCVLRASCVFAHLLVGGSSLLRYVLERRKNYKLVGKRSGKLSCCTKLAGCGARRHLVLPVIVLIGVHSMAHYNRLGVQLAYVSLAVALARSLDVISDPAMSYATDSFLSKMGRRRRSCSLGLQPALFVLFLAPPNLHTDNPAVRVRQGTRALLDMTCRTPILTFLLSPPLARTRGERAKQGQLGLAAGPVLRRSFYIMFFLAGTFTNIPYDAFGPELTDNYDDRSNLFFVASLLTGLARSLPWSRRGWGVVPVAG